MEKIILSNDQIKELYFYFIFDEEVKITSTELDFEAQEVKIHLIDKENKKNYYNVSQYLGGLRTRSSGTMLKEYPKEWEQDKQDLKPDSKGIMYPYAYAYNLDIPDYSDLGRIGIIRKNGGISRVY